MSSSLSPAEYQELQQQVAELSIEDASLELLECARYNEVDAVQALLEGFGPEILHFTDEAGSTALHKASANGCDKIVQLLLHHGATLSQNASGNTALHWAAANGHTNVVKLLLEHFDSVDVLEKNSFGRSALTEGFGSKSTETAKLLLEHESASEDRLLSTSTDCGVMNEDAKGEEKTSDNFVVHEFDFNKRRIRVRELVIPDQPLDDVDPSKDATGYGIWAASLVMASWMAGMGSSLADKVVVELGAGCGVPGLTVQAKQIILTDLNPVTVDNLQYNIDLNERSGNTQALVLDWSQPSSLQTDVLIGSDLIYSKSIVPLLLHIISVLNPENFYYVAPDTGRDGLQEFLKQIPLELVSRETAPKAYYANPLVSGDEDECYLHFHELASSTYILYEFKRR
jgi:hypothetical protein